MEYSITQEYLNGSSREKRFFQLDRTIGAWSKIWRRCSFLKNNLVAVAPTQLNKARLL